MEALYEKIAKLLNKADSARSLSSIEEAEVFSAKAMELMMKHSISMQSVDSARSKKDSQIKREGGIEYGKIKSDGTFEIDLITLVSRNTGCKALYNTYFKTMSVVGRGEDVPSVIFIYETVRDAIRLASRSKYIDMVNEVKDKVHVGSDICNNKDEAADMLSMICLLSYSGLKRAVKAEDVSYDKTRKAYVISRPEVVGLVPYREVFIRNFLKGAVVGVDRQMKRAKATSKHCEEYGLVLVDRDKQIAEFLKDVKVRTVSSRDKIHDAAAFQSGVKVGETVSMHRGIEDEVDELKALEQWKE